MADSIGMALDELLRKAQMEQNVDGRREGVRVFSQALMELEVTQHVGAQRHERDLYSRDCSQSRLLDISHTSSQFTGVTAWS
jgi:transposase-like protein